MISCAQTHVAHLFSCHEYVLARTPAIMDRKAEPLSFGSDHCTSLLHFTCDFVFEGKKFVLGRVALAARPAWPSRLQRGWMRPAPGFTRRPSPPFPPVTKLSRTTVTERTRLGRELNCRVVCRVEPHTRVSGSKLPPADANSAHTRPDETGVHGEGRPWRG